MRQFIFSFVDRHEPARWFGLFLRRGLTSMNGATFNQALDELFAVFMALKAHFVCYLFSIEIGILISFTIQCLLLLGL